MSKYTYKVVDKRITEDGATLALTYEVLDGTKVVTSSVLHVGVTATAEDVKRDLQGRATALQALMDL